MVGAVKGAWLLVEGSLFLVTVEGSECELLMA